MAGGETTSLLVLILIALPVLVFAIQSLRTEPSGHEGREYKEGDYIPLFANIAYPEDSDRGSCEGYSYFDLPFCPPGDPIPNRKKSFQELISGNCYVNTGYDIRFKMNAEGKLLCEKTLTREEVAKFRDAAENYARYEMYIDNILIKERVGMCFVYPFDEHRQYQYVARLLSYLIHHLDLTVYYFENKVQSIFVSPDESAVDITKDAEIKVNFTYTVHWVETEKSEREVGDISDQFGGDNPMPYAIAIAICGWLGLLCFVTVPYLRKYFTRNSAEITRHIHGDNCWCPRYSSLLGANLGVGNQLFIIICVLFVLAYTGHLYTCNNENQYIQLIVIYGFASWVSGYKATSFHSGFTKRGWKECVIQTGALYPIPVILTSLATTIEAKTTSYLIFFFFIAIVLLTFGGRSGLTSLNESEITCSTRHFQSEIPNQAWYMRTPAQMFLGGLLPFSIIYSMMDDIYASLYSLKVCGAFSTIFIAFISVIALTVVVGIICTCYQLYKQDHQWWWRSVFRGGSIAIFMFAYGLYFYARAKAKISLSLLKFLGYNACIFYGVFLILGTIGFYASSIGFHYMGRVLERRD